MSHDPRAQAVTDYLTFAETFARFRSNDTDVRNIYGLAPLLREAERHARLLHTIAQYVHVDPVVTDSPDYNAGDEAVRKHIRSLMEQP